jgi:hypothetical protein
MTRTIGFCTLICAATIVIVIAASSLSMISDKNDFLHHFVNHELLSLLGIIMTITLASAANLHLEFNKIEERFKQRGLTKTRHGVMQSAYCLIGLFFISVVIVVTKPIAAHNEVSEALFNGAALFVLLWNILILIEITQMAFAIRPTIEDD